MIDKPHSAACDRNKDPIKMVLGRYLSEGRLIEIGTGTGQHAIHLAPYFPQVEWVTSDVLENHSGIKAWLEEAGLANIKGPISYRVGQDEFPSGSFNYIFTANTLHIMPWNEVQVLIQQVGQNALKGTKMFIYGPFNYNGSFTTSSNESFDLSLKERNPLSGIRDFEQVQDQLEKVGFGLIKDHDMPANNRFLVFERNQ